ncbi:hypothetical protein LVJ94_09970 [Pendulispora rubella]|uniref:Secreted protein n=1 Tax=Pendulispora rubella TaxID=2741070 RepID=A0ABZ2LEF8_9BACT
MLVFALIMMVWVVFPRAAVAQGVVYIPNVQGVSVPLVQAMPESEEELSDSALLDVGGGMESDGPDVVHAGLGLAPQPTVVLGASDGHSKRPLEPLVRISQPFIGLHDKVPR